jgi:hypothetical protein
MRALSPSVKACGGFFAIGGHELSERGEQARLRKAVAVNAIVARFRPGFVAGSPVPSFSVRDRKQARSRE